MKQRLVVIFVSLAALMFLSACGSLGSYHKVVQGETLYSISWRYGQDYRKVAAWNHINPPYLIHQGDRLRISPPSAVAAVSTRKSARVPVVVKSTSQTPQHRITRLQRPSVRLQNSRKIIWSWPAQGGVIKKFSATDNKGIDIAGRKGDPVRAATGGRVVYSGSGLPHYGKLIIIKHNDKFLSAYAHNNRLLVKEGALVKRGQQIAVLGRSGTGVSRVMLHFEIRADGAPVDPLRYLPTVGISGRRSILP